MNSFNSQKAQCAVQFSIAIPMSKFVNENKMHQIESKRTDEQMTLSHKIIGVMLNAEFTTFSHCCSVFKCTHTDSFSKWSILYLQICSACRAWTFYKSKKQSGKRFVDSFIYIFQGLTIENKKICEIKTWLICRYVEQKKAICVFYWCTSKI